MALASIAPLAHVPAAGTGSAGAVATTGPTTAGTLTIGVIVREAPGHGAEAIRSTQLVGGTPGVRLGLIDGFAATIPGAALASLRRAPGVLDVAIDRHVRMSSSSVASGSGATTAMADLEQAIGARDLWSAGITGAGVDVAVIDTGVVPVDGLAGSGTIVNGPDLSFDQQAGAPPYLDTFGHGTHVASIIAGRDGAIPGGAIPGTGDFAGIAPDARIISLKVGSAGGEADISQVIAAIDWVVGHKDQNGLHIRVLNLSFGTDAVQDYQVDPLAYAAEVAWRRGIVVVTAAGNAGESRARLADPAVDPYVLAVGAADLHGTLDTTDDTVPAWSSPGDAARAPDLVAPGVAVPGLRDPGSILDLSLPSASGSRFIRGSGTSQAAAVVSGAVALLLQGRPGLKPDQVKALLTNTARPLAAADPLAQGAGLIDVLAASRASVPGDAPQRWPHSSGTGSLDAARGSAVVQVSGTVLQGERDIFGMAWGGARWAQETYEGDTWHGGRWNGHVWAGNGPSDSSSGVNGWQTVPWAGLSWSGLSWSGLSWSGLSWSGLSWSGLSWSGLSWSGLSWSGLSWSGLSWSGLSWSGGVWATTSWAGE
jgi:serine protease AprX